MSEAINLGIAPDGGLFLPKSFPKFKEDSFKNLYDLSLDEFAFNVLYPFFLTKYNLMILQRYVPKLLISLFTLRIFQKNYIY